jgi:hypothetical protein
MCDHVTKRSKHRQRKARLKMSTIICFGNRSTGNGIVSTRETLPARHFSFLSLILNIVEREIIVESFDIETFLGFHNVCLPIARLCKMPLLLYSSLMNISYCQSRQLASFSPPAVCPINKVSVQPTFVRIFVICWQLFVKREWKHTKMNLQITNIRFQQQSLNSDMWKGLVHSLHNIQFVGF